MRRLLVALLLAGALLIPATGAGAASPTTLTTTVWIGASATTPIDWTPVSECRSGKDSDGISYRCAFEFSFAGIPPGLTLQDAILHISQVSSSASGLAFNLTGYQGDGVATPSDVYGAGPDLLAIFAASGPKAYALPVTDYIIRTPSIDRQWVGFVLRLLGTSQGFPEGLIDWTAPDDGGATLELVFEPTATPIATTGVNRGTPPPTDTVLATSNLPAGRSAVLSLLLTGLFFVATLLVMRRVGTTSPRARRVRRE